MAGQEASKAAPAQRPGRRMRIDAACGGEFPLVLFPFLCGVGLKIEGG